MIETVAGLTDLQIKLFTAIGQLLLAAAVGYVAWRQWRTAEQQAKTAQRKLKFELFDRRLAVYEAVTKATVEAMSINGKDKELELIKPMSEARWLFGADMYEFIYTKLYIGLVNLSEIRSERETLGTMRQAGGEILAKYNAAAVKSGELRKQVSADLTEFRKKMDAYLILEH